jgi:hypothetical protein
VKLTLFWGYMQRILFKEGFPLTTYWRAHQAKKVLLKFLVERIESVLKVRRAASLRSERQRAFEAAA